MRDPEPFAELSATSVTEGEPSRAVVEQPPLPELDNHAGVRHAGALFAVGYAASRALVDAALGGVSGAPRARMVDSEVAYEKMVSAERVTATAEPTGNDWDALLERAAAGESVQLPTTVTLRDEKGRTVTAMAVCWQVGPDDGQGR